MIKDLIDLIEQLTKKYGFPEILANNITITLILTSISISILGGCKSIISAIIKRRNRRFLNRNLSPYFSALDVINATRYYIPTKFQNVSPAEDDEPSKRYLAYAKQNLMPLILKKIFPGNVDNNKHYIILADTGMGKTTFLINLYLKYKNSFRFKWQLPLSKIYLFPLGAEGVLNKISAIEDKTNSILLLDAFDEDIQAVINYEKRLKEILDIVNEFDKIIITCRTQFFPSKVEEPHETGYISYGGSGASYFQKIYISVFDNRDVTKYLRLRYSYLNPFKIRSYLKAKKIIRRSPNLTVRPMLLSYINDFLEQNKTFYYSFQIYQVLIEKWIIRESEKPRIRSKYISAENFQNLLYRFLLTLSWNMFSKRQERGGYYISENEDFKEDGIGVKDIGDDELEVEEKRARSLLNRNSVGKYKFSHKSILEYFLAIQLFEKEEIFFSFDFMGMDAAKLFFNEMVIKFLKTKSGKFFSPRNKKYLPLQSLTMLNYIEIVAVRLNLVDSIPIYYFSHFKNISYITFIVTDKKFLIIEEVFKQRRKKISQFEGHYEKVILYCINNKFNRLANFFKFVESNDRSASEYVDDSLVPSSNSNVDLNPPLRYILENNRDVFKLFRDIDRKLIDVNATQKFFTNKISVDFQS